MKTHSPFRLLVAAITICVLSTYSFAAPPEGGKGKGNRQDGDRKKGNARPEEMASKMIADHDKNRDKELQVEELVVAIVAQREQRGGQQGAGQQPAGDGGPRGRRAGQGGKQPGAGKGRGQQGARGQGAAGRGTRGKGGQGQGARGKGARGQGRGNASSGQVDAVAMKMISEFDKNGSRGLDVSELVASIEAQRQRRGGRAEQEGNVKRGRGKNGEERNGEERKGGKKKRERGEREEVEPGAGVVPARPTA
ncbi:MAG: hypothetical protein AAFX06_05600 [Planctomycetota bacterium]